MKAILTAVVLIVMMAMAGIAVALVEEGWPLDTPNTYDGQHVMIDFEDGMLNKEVIISPFDDIRFVTMDNLPWVYATKGEGMNIYPYGTGNYIVNGESGAWCNTPGSRGMITFEDDVMHVSILVSTYSGVEIDAYNREDELVASSGMALGNTGTMNFTRLSVDRNESDIAYIVVHDSGNYWLADDIVISRTATFDIDEAFNNDTIPIVVRGAVNVGSCDITLSYDASIVTVTNVTGRDMSNTVSNIENAVEGLVRIGAYQGGDPGIDGRFVLADVTFERVSDGICPLEISVTTFKDDTPEGNSMIYLVNNGSYCSYQNGDVNGDGDVDMFDVMYLAKHAIGISTFSDIIEATADVNGDGIIDIDDAKYLAKYIIGIDGYEDLK